MNLFQKLFGKREKKLSKIEYWKKWEIFELFDNLHNAVQLLNSIKFNGDRDEKFKAEFIDEVTEIEEDNVADFTRFWKWVSPNSEWDNIAGSDGEELGKRIFKRTDRWKRNQAFIP